MNNFNRILTEVLEEGKPQWRKTFDGDQQGFSLQLPADPEMGQDAPVNVMVTWDWKRKEWNISSSLKPGIYKTAKSDKDLKRMLISYTGYAWPPKLPKFDKSKAEPGKF